MDSTHVKLCVDLVFKILFYFLTKRNSYQHSNHLYFNIELRSKEKELWYIYVSNRGQNIVDPRGSEFIFQEIVTSCFTDVLDNREFQSHLISVIFVENEGDGKQKTFELKQSGGEDEHLSIIEDINSTYFSHRKKYQTLRLEFNIKENDVEVFKHSTITELRKLHELEPYIKLVFHSGDDIFWRNKEDLGEAIDNCKFVGEIIGSIINSSENSSFQNKCLSLLRVDKLSQAGRAVSNKIVSLIREHHRVKRRSRNNNESWTKKKKSS